jgi:hypothetical protein
LYETFIALQMVAGNLIARFIHYISFASASKVKDQHHSSRMQSINQQAETQQATTAPDGYERPQKCDQSPGMRPQAQNNPLRTRHN